MKKMGENSKDGRGEKKSSNAHTHKHTHTRQDRMDRHACPTPHPLINPSTHQKYICCKDAQLCLLPCRSVGISSSPPAGDSGSLCTSGRKRDQLRIHTSTHMHIPWNNEGYVSKYKGSGEGKDEKEECMCIHVDHCTHSHYWCEV